MTTPPLASPPSTTASAAKNGTPLSTRGSPPTRVEKLAAVRSFQTADTLVACFVTRDPAPLARN